MSSGCVVARSLNPGNAFLPLQYGQPGSRSPARLKISMGNECPSPHLHQTFLSGRAVTFSALRLPFFFIPLLRQLPVRGPQIVHPENALLIAADGASVAVAMAVVHAVCPQRHARLHDRRQEPPAPDRNTREVQAESVTFVVSNWLGLDTSDYSFGYIASWSSSKEISVLHASLDDVRLTSHGITDSIEEKILGTRNRESRNAER